NTLFDDAGRQVLEDFERFYEKARAANITVLASSGDTGSTNPDVFEQLYPFRSVGFPASSPLVTAVGGTSLYADTDGNYQYETVWNNRGAGGGGISQYFGEPDYQTENLPASSQELLDQHRGIPDVAFNADPSTGILFYVSFPGIRPGYYLTGGTSAGSPQWAGIIAVANQLVGHPLGFLNPGLYSM